MMIAEIRIGTLLFLLCTLAGCGAPVFNLPTPAERELFAQGLDQYGQAGETRILETLPQEYPEGEWSRRAETVLQLIEEQRQQTAALAREQQSLAREQQSLAECQQEKAYLASDNQMLEATLEQLKQLLIDMEMRAE